MAAIDPRSNGRDREDFRSVRSKVRIASIISTGDVPGDGPEVDDGLDALDIALQTSLEDLSRLSAARLGLERTLTRVAQLAVRAIPGADGAGLTLIEADLADTVVSTDPFVNEVDAIHYRIGQGPCISAAAERRTLSSVNCSPSRRRSPSRTRRSSPRASASPSICATSWTSAAQ